MKAQPQKLFYFKRLIKPAVLNKPAIHAEDTADPVSKDIHLPDFNTLKASMLVPVIRLINSFRIAAATFFVSLFNDSYNFILNRKQTVFSATTGDYEKRKLGIFNQLNLFQLITGIMVPINVILTHKTLPGLSALIFISPPLINLLVLFLNSKQKNLEAMIFYFALYPFFTNIAYIDSFNLGTELFFVIYGILSVFFLQHIIHFVFCIGFNTVNYFMLVLLLKRYQSPGEVNHPVFFLLNHLMAIVIIFYCLYLVKKENAGYQSRILEKNTELELINEEVKKQKEVIAEKARQLEKHTLRLNEIDAFKNRLFSIVSHDLKAPLYALQKLFTEVQQQGLPPEEISDLIPDVIKDLNYATGLTDNLLNWAKSQMHAGTIHPQVLNVSSLINEVVQQQRLQADLKGVKVNSQMQDNLFIYADCDMTRLVLRNLLSNAVKFTPQDGVVTVGVNALNSYVEIFINDTGAGMDAEALNKIRSNDYFTTRGTDNEQGTGLGLMLCKEFLEKNKGQLHIESTPGGGSTFSFTLPKAKQ